MGNRCSSGAAVYLWAVLLSSLIALAALAVCGVWPFGSEYLSWIDNQQQVAPDFGYVRQMFSGRADLFWNYACGGLPRASVHPTFIDLVSPVSWLVAFIPGVGLLPKLSILFVSILALMPLGVVFYLRRTFPRLPMALMICYALGYTYSSFLFTKYTALNLLYPAILFPFYLYGVDMLLSRGRWGLYTLLLGLMMAVGTHYAYMWLLFTIVYAACRVGWRWHSPIRQYNARLLLATLLAVALSAVVWLPSAFITFSSSRAGGIPLTMLATADFHLEEVSCWLCPALILAGIFGRKNFSWQSFWKTRHGSIAFILLVALLLIPASLLWHASVPRGFVARFSYMFTLMLICMASAGWRPRQHVGVKNLPIVLYLVPLLPLVVCGWLAMKGYTGLDTAREWVWSLLCIPGFLIIRRSYRSAPGLTAVCCIIPLSMVITRCVKSSHDSAYYAYARLQLAEWAQAELTELRPETCRGRLKGVGHQMLENASLLESCDGVSSFLASQSDGAEEALHRWGYARNYGFRLFSEGGTLFSDTLLGTRYFVVDGDMLEKRGLISLAEGGTRRLYENPWYFGMGIMLPAGVNADLQGLSPLQAQRKGMKLIPGEREDARAASHRLPAEVETGHWDYLYQENHPYEQACAYDGSMYDAFAGCRIALPSLQLLPANKPVRIDARSTGVPADVRILSVPESSLAALKDYACQLPVEVDYAGRHMDIRCTSTAERGMLFLPYFWSACYTAQDEQGRPLDVNNNGGFISMTFTEPGQHHVRLTWHRPRALLGWSLTGVGLLVLLLMWRFGGKTLLPGSWFDTLCRRGLQLGAVVIFFAPLVACVVAKAHLFWL